MCILYRVVLINWHFVFVRARMRVAWDGNLKFWRATWVNPDGSSGYRFFSGARFTRAEAVELANEAALEEACFHQARKMSRNRDIMGKCIPINQDRETGEKPAISVAAGIPGASVSRRRKCAVERVFQISTENAFFNESKLFKL